jgi:hypothetical protein
METLAVINHSMMVKLPLGVQSILKSLPFSDFSIILIIGSTLIIVILLLLNFCTQDLTLSATPYPETKNPKESKEKRTQHTNTQNKSKKRNSKSHSDHEIHRAGKKKGEGSLNNLRRTSEKFE